MEPVVFVTLAIVGVVLGVMSRRAGRRMEKRAARLSRDQAVVNDARVVVSGWSAHELGGILRAFAKLHGIDGAFAAHRSLDDSATGVHEIRFPEGIEPQLLLFLVNGLNYPVGYSLSDRDIGVAGYATLTKGFDPPDPSLVGEPVTVYVPADDLDHDVVYVHGPLIGSYALAFSNHRWRRVQDARMPAAVASLDSVAAGAVPGS